MPAVTCGARIRHAGSCRYVGRSDGASVVDDGGVGLESKVGDADWLAAYGQVAGATFTALAVLVALWVALRDSRLRRQEERQRAEAQSRLVIFGPVHAVVMGDRVAVRDAGKNRSKKRVFREVTPEVEYHLIMYVENLGDRPILDLTLTGQVASWEMHDSRYVDKRPLLASSLSYLKSGGRGHFTFTIPQATDIRLSSCAVSWRDADGRFWELALNLVAFNNAADEEQRRREPRDPHDPIFETGDEILQRIVGTASDPDDASGGHHT
jgi:hypothetical protein